MSSFTSPAFTPLEMRTISNRGFFHLDFSSVYAILWRETREAAGSGINTRHDSQPVLSLIEEYEIDGIAVLWFYKEM
jgi:hypothetical protein